ncbi:nucleoporin protein Ndc1-Nup [Xylaria digitata]|nr:nucleoporin protein Ndc1-Nup [Xylaria digitata]
MSSPVARRAPYKDFLQPALQRRFAGTAGIILILAYVESLTLSRWDSLIWSWIPLGLPGLRALAIFLCVLPIIILRIALSHMGIRTSNSVFETLFKTVLSFSTLETLLTYVISAFLFSQVYLKCTPEAAGIRWISYAIGRPRLNEHALFYTVDFLVLGLVQGVIHVAGDMDRLVLGVVVDNPTDGDGNEGDEGNRAAPSDTETWAARIGEWTPILIMRCGILAITVALANYIFLYHFVRLSAWRSSMWFFRFLYSDLPKWNIPTSGAPWSFWMLGRTIWASFLLSLLWYFGEVAFRVQQTREPLKRGQPLSSESKDPNGSLLNGLQSKKPRIFAFAMWELAFIARDYPARRQAIFEDIDRRDGPMWSQIYTLCLSTVQSIQHRIDEYGKAPAPVPSTEPVAAPMQPRERISQPVRANDVSAPRPVDKGALLTDTISRLVTSPGRTPVEDWMPVIRRRAGQVADRVMTQEQKEAIRPQVLRGHLWALALRVLSLPVIGPIFQQTFDRRLAKVVLGTPYAESSVYINATYALSRLAVHSLAEDRYGNVQRDVPAIIRTFTAVINRLEAFRDGFPAHWTDLSRSRQSVEVTEVLVALKDGLNVVLTAFGPYSGDLRLGRADMRMAREAAARGAEERQPEMQQRQQRQQRQQQLG